MCHDHPPPSRCSLGGPHYGPDDGDEEQDGEQSPQDPLQYEGLLHPRPGAPLYSGQRRRIDEDPGAGEKDGDAVAQYVGQVPVQPLLAILEAFPGLVLRPAQAQSAPV